jgi:hypothetical protein
MLARAKDKNDPFRLSGFGHRVYKSYDPRAKVLRPLCHELLAALGREDSLLALAMELEKIALEDDYFIQRKLYPNVDFYSGILFRALGLPPAMFTPVFAVARTVGWVAHWNEMMSDPETRIVRPRQLYVGPGEQQVGPIELRPGATAVGRIGGCLTYTHPTRSGTTACGALPRRTRARPRSSARHPTLRFAAVILNAGCARQLPPAVPPRAGGIARP